MSRVRRLGDRWRQAAELASWKKPPYRAIQARIGHELKTPYGAPRELPCRFIALLKQLDVKQLATPRRVQRPGA
jgi:hypothetical protein